jgi:hypothetical protein
MKMIPPLIIGAAAGLVLYVLHAPSFLIPIAAVGVALIASAKLWDRPLAPRKARRWRLRKATTRN